MKLSRESEYALHGLAFLARQRPGTVLTLRTIARAQHLPPVFLAKIFRKLARCGVLVSSRGGRRGYALARPAAQITIREILEAVEGSGVFTRCVFWSNRCSDERPCVLHDLWKTVRPRVIDLMTATTLRDLARRDVAAPLAAVLSDGLSAPASPTERRPPGA
jgi:Rrf2 family iron-sulfur cluster assembly transcriptional regulator